MEGQNLPDTDIKLKIAKKSLWRVWKKNKSRKKNENYSILVFYTLSGIRLLPEGSPQPDLGSSLAQGLIVPPFECPTPSYSFSSCILSIYSNVYIHPKFGHKSI